MGASNPFSHLILPYPIAFSQKGMKYSKCEILPEHPRWLLPQCCMSLCPCTIVRHISTICSWILRSDQIQPVNITRYRNRIFMYQGTPSQRPIYLLGLKSHPVHPKDDLESGPPPVCFLFMFLAENVKRSKTNPNVPWE